MIDRSLYIGSNGASNLQGALQVIANNMANANSTGFRADLMRFRSEAVTGPGFETRTFTVAEGTGSSFAQGSMMTTGRDLDVAIKGDGWIAVQSPSGKEAYTRAGNLAISQEGLLTTQNGSYVLGNNGPIAIPPSAKISIGNDGTISVIQKGQDERSLTSIDRIKLVNPEPKTISKGTDGLFYVADGQAPADGEVMLVSGMLEGSNVNIVDSLVSMIELQREFEYNIKMMQTIDENGTKADQLLSINR